MPNIYPVSRKKFEKFLNAQGCVLTRIKGDHFIYSKPGLKRPVVITNDKEISQFYIRSNLRTLGISPDDFLKSIRKF